MSDFNRIMAKELSKIKGKIVRGNTIGNIDPIIEWIKWLSYIPIHEKKRIEFLYSKNITDLSIDELKEIINYKERNHMVKLFKKYDKYQCSEDEYLEVYDYMGKSIKELMIDKLNSEELLYAKKEILKLSSIDQKELKIKINKEQKPEIYSKLSMVDSYILHIISDINYRRDLAKLESEIETKLNQNHLMREKSLYHANKNY